MVTDDWLKPLATPEWEGLTRRDPSFAGFAFTRTFEF
jgi:hypothetical protein